MSTMRAHLDTMRAHLDIQMSTMRVHLDIQMSIMSIAPEPHFARRFLFDRPQILISGDVVWAIPISCLRLLWNVGLEVSGE